MLGPIFVREWLTVPRRAHHVIRSTYLGLLWILGLTAWQATVGWRRTATLGDTAQFGMLLFQVLIYVQMTLLLFFSALSAASAIALEKDRRTFLLLLLTDMRNHEIVLGKLLGSLLQIVLLLLGMTPILALVMLLGGVAPAQIGQAALVLASTVLAAGSLGGLVALWRDRTFQSLALTVLLLVLYLSLVNGLSVIPDILAWVSGPGDELGSGPQTNWRTVQAWLDPIQALASILDPPAGVDVWLSPSYGFTLVMLGLSVLLNLWGIARLRVWNPSGEPIMQRERPEDEDDKDRAKAHAAPGEARRVWANPILWREMRTRAYGRRPLLVKAAYFLVLGLVCYYAFFQMFSSSGRAPFLASWGLVPVTILSLLLVAAQAVTAITSERDGQALDLLLVTDLSPREFIFGKLGGIGYNTKEFLLPPLVLTGVYAALGLLASPPRNHPELAASKNVEALVCVAVALVVLLAFVIVLGIHVALHNVNSQQAVVNTLGTVFFLSVGTLICIALILINGRFEYQWTSFILFIVAGVGGLWFVLSADQPSPALTMASWVCPLAVFYTVTNILIGKPGSTESTDPLWPFLLTSVAFGFTVAAMLVPLLSEFDVALGRTTRPGE